MSETTHIQVESARHQIAMEAAYEIEFLSNVIREKAKDAGDLIDIALRGLAVRLSDLSGVISQALDNADEATSTNDLSMKLRGEDAEQEASHV